MNNRDRCLLVDSQVVDSSRESLVHMIKEHWDYALELGPTTGTESSAQFSLTKYFASTLLLRNKDVAELYDEVRSAACLIAHKDKSISSIETRSQSLINPFLSEVAACRQLVNEKVELEEALSMQQLQINQMMEELEQNSSAMAKQEEIVSTLTESLAADQLLRITRKQRR